MHAAGIAVGLGTDSVASNDRVDLLGEARQAALLYAWQRGQPDALSAHDALTMATRGGARALGLDASIGTLEVGKSADLAAFSLAQFDAQPVHDPAVTLVHVLAGAAPATLVVVAGQTRVRNGVVLHADPGRHARMTALGERLRAWRSAYLSASS
jgi:5-methylthioadenosine/S-adenosylhomocysteine deaminase